ncbi:MAG TPA: DNA-binding protein [candidate division Zixibacteria bacterium]|nr:DNA-binding protein [candidate division Zixibacteria bacterium]
MNYREEFDGSYLLCLEIGDDIIASIAEFALEEGIRGAIFMGIGAIDRAEIGYFDLVRKEYARKAISGQRELLSLKGNIGIADEGEIVVHAHVILGDADMNCIGGHLFSSRISVTGEIAVHPVSDIVRSPENTTGLKLWNLRA